jgi:hypothetical protein
MRNDFGSDDDEIKEVPAPPKPPPIFIDLDEDGLEVSAEKLTASKTLEPVNSNG